MMRLKRVIYMLPVALTLMNCQSGTHRDQFDQSPERKESVSYNHEALLLSEQGRDREAIYLFHKALSFPDIPDTIKGINYANLGLSYRSIGMDDSAKFFYAKAAKCYPFDSYQNLANRAELFYIEENIDSTIALLERAYNIDSTIGDVNNLLGVIYLREFDKEHFNPQKAFRYNFSTHKVAQTSTTKFMLAKNYYHLGQMDVALRLFREIYEDYPNYGYYLSSLIMVEQEMNHTAEAERLLQILKKTDPELYYERIANPVKPGTHEIVWSQGNE